MYGTFWALLPPIVAILLALITKEVYSSLFVGIIVGGLSQELFLTGMFSVLDLMLDKTMEEALSMVKISKSIDEALLHRKGDLGEILSFIEEYETASWQEVSRQMVLRDIDMDSVYGAYLDSLRWFKDLLTV